MNILAKILFSKIRADVFRLLFSAIDKDMAMREIEKRLGVSMEALRSELKKLTDLDLVIKRREGGRTYFRANTNHPLYPDIRNLVQKAKGLTGELKKRRKG